MHALGLNLENEFENMNNYNYSLVGYKSRVM